MLYRPSALPRLLHVRPLYHRSQIISTQQPHPEFYTDVPILPLNLPPIFFSFCSFSFPPSLFPSLLVAQNSDHLRSFTGQVKVHSLLIYTAPTPAAPKTLKLFKNRDDLDFATASELKPTQSVEIPQPVPGADVFDLPLNRAYWNATTSITLFLEDNWSNGDEDVTKVGYVGFKGQFMALNREPVSFLYEAAANPSDHVAIQGVTGVGGRIMPGQ